MLRYQGAKLGRIAVFNLDRGMTNAKPITQLIAGTTQQGIIRALPRTNQVDRQSSLSRGQPPNVQIVSLCHAWQPGQVASYFLGAHVLWHLVESQLHGVPQQPPGGHQD